MHRNLPSLVTIPSMVLPFLLGLSSGEALAQARPVTPPAPPAAAAPKPVDPAFAAAEKAFLAQEIEARRAIQRDLIWVAKFEGAISGDFGPLTFAAIKRFQTEAKQLADGILAAPLRARLAAEADKQRQSMKFAVQTDKISGMRIGLPGTIFVKSSANTSGGGRWQDKDDKVTLDLLVYKPEDSLATLFEKGTDPKVTTRKIIYKLIRPDFFVISGETPTGKFYRRVQLEGGALKGFSIGYDKAVASAVDPMVIAIASTFDPSGKSGTDKSGTDKGGGDKAAPKPPGTPIAEAPRPAQRRATGLVLAPDVILTAEAALKGCTEIAALTEPSAPRVAAKLVKSLDGTGLAIYSARAGKALPVRIAGENAASWVMVQRDGEGDLAASAAVIVNGKATTSLQEGGAGAVLFDRSGALAGVINAPPVTKFRVAGVVPALGYGFTPAADVLKAAGLPAGSAGEGAAKSSAEIGETVRASLVSLLCASDK